MTLERNSLLQLALLLHAAVSCGGSEREPAALDPPGPDLDAAAQTEADSGSPSAESVLAAWPMPDAVAGAANQPDYDVSAKTVTDKVTRLIWQRELPAIYPGCTGKSRLSNAGGAGGSGSQLGDNCTWAEAKRYCQSAELAAAMGSSGWRLPSKIELESLADHARIDPALDTTVFGSTPDESFWSSTLYVGQDDAAWYINFDEGTTDGIRNTVPFRVRCVASPTQPDAGGDQYDVASRTVKDRKTGLTWQRYVDPNEYEWEEAKQFCAQLELDGSGWRLPTVKELLTLVDPTRSAPAIDPMVFPLTPSNYFWTASPVAKSSALAWYVMFSYGGPDSTTTNFEYRVRCVR